MRGGEERDRGHKRGRGRMMEGKERMRERKGQRGQELVKGRTTERKEERLCVGGGDAKERWKMKYQRSVEVITQPTLPPILNPDCNEIKSKITVKHHFLLSRPL